MSLAKKPVIYFSDLSRARLSANLEILFKSRPRLRSLWQEEIAQIDSILADYRIEKDTLGNFLFFEKDQILDSSRADFFPSVTRDPHLHTLVISGLGFGCLLNQVAAVYSNQIQFWVLAESSVRRFFAALAAADFGEWISDPEITFVVGIDLHSLAGELLHYFLPSRIRLYRGKASQVILHPVLNAVELGYFEFLQTVWDNALLLAKNTCSHKADGMLGLKYVFENLPWIESHPGIDQLKDQFAGVPAIVCSTGPSLKKSLPQLKALQNKALILAADTSLKILLKEGITPHFVFTLERELGSKPYLDLPEATFADPVARTQLVAFPVVPFAVIDSYRAGPHWVAYRDYEYFQFLEQCGSPRGTMQCGPSVAHMAARFADHLGCSQAVLIGQDLGFDPETMQSHSAGVENAELSEAVSVEERQRRLEAEFGAEGIFFLPGNLIEKVPTFSFYSVFAQVFTDHARTQKTPIINATEGGIKISGLQWVDFKKWTSDWKVEPALFHRIAAIQQASQSALAGAPPTDLKPIHRYLEGIISETRNMQSVVNATAQFSSLPFANFVEKVRDQQWRLMNSPAFGGLIAHFLGHRIVVMEWSWDAIDADDFKAKSEWLIAWCQEVLEMAEEVRALLPSTLPIRAVEKLGFANPAAANAVQKPPSL